MGMPESLTPPPPTQPAFLQPLSLAHPLGTSPGPPEADKKDARHRGSRCYGLLGQRKIWRLREMESLTLACTAEFEPKPC